MAYSAREIGSTMVAEGVATEAARGALTRPSIGLAQGYLLRRPLAINAIRCRSVPTARWRS